MITVHLDTLRTETRSLTVRGKTTDREVNTVEISIGDDRRRVRCGTGSECMRIYGLAVRFRTGTKVWPASAIYWNQTGHVNNLRPNIDKFNGQFCRLVGYFEDYQTTRRPSGRLWRLTMSTTHTPGPWHCSALPHIPMLSAYTYERDETGDDRPVALPVTDANAALIAAAPDLLKALQKFIDVMESCSYYPDTASERHALCQAAVKAKAAIFKATQEA